MFSFTRLNIPLQRFAKVYKLKNPEKAISAEIKGISKEK